MKTTTSSAPPRSVSRASSLEATATSPLPHRESSETLGDRPRRRGCGNCGQGCCGNDRAPEADEETTLAQERAPHEAPAPVRGGALGWLADRPWLFVLAAFSLLIGVWATFITLALKNPPRDVLKNPLPATTDVRPGH